jgi:hypothetical protein
MQKRPSKILLPLFLACITTLWLPAQTPERDETLSYTALVKADSLFAARQYTQALDLYRTLRVQNAWSPAMLLKMAYIEEGLGRLGESLYYLNLYHLASGDPQALKKMEELAEKNQLEGYQPDQTTQIYTWLQDQYYTVTIALAAVAMLFVALVFNHRKTRATIPGGWVTCLILTLALLYLHVNRSDTSRRGIVTSAPTYLMSGPSAGSTVIAIIGEGHQLHIQGKQDVWLKVEWKEEVAYVKESLVRPVAL